MGFNLPYSNFKLLDNSTQEFKELEKIIFDKEVFFEKFNEESNFGMIIEFDAEIDPEYHDYLDQLPPLPEKLMIGNVAKLVGNLYNKKNYLAHYLMVQMAIRLNVRITKIHKIITFNQNKVTKKYVDLMNNLRQQQTSPARIKSCKNWINMLYVSDYKTYTNLIYVRENICVRKLKANYSNLLNRENLSKAMSNEI